MTIYDCVRCGHQWASRKIDAPRRCAKCKAPYYWRQARIPKPKSEPGKVGSKLRFPQLETLEPGQSCLIPFQETNDMAADMKYNTRPQRAVDYIARSKGWKVYSRAQGNALHVLRVL